MATLIFFLNWIYLVAIAIMTCVTVGIYGRSNRSPIYYPLSLCGLFIILTFFLKLMELHAINRPSLQVFAALGLLFFSVVLVLFIHIFYVLISRARFPLFFQMISGAGALVIFFIFMQYTAPMRQAYTRETISFQFLIYALLPYLTFILYLPLLVFLIKKNRINTTKLSFDKVLRTIPDQVMIFDRTGKIIDSNHSDLLFGDCKNISDLSSQLREKSGENAKPLIEALKLINQRCRGEIEWADKKQSFCLWSWSFQPVKNKRKKIIGAILIFSDITPVRSLSLQLHTQNDELKDINRQLSSYSELIEHYSGAAAQKEIADIIDHSVRLKLDHMAQILDSVSDTETHERQIIIEDMIRDGRLALADIRSLVHKLAK